MRILVSGSSGFVGSALVGLLKGEGHEVVRLVRRDPKPGAGEVSWDPAAGKIDKAGIEGLDAAVHLAGENIASGRWNDERKAQIRESRIQGTRLLATALASASRPPKVLVSASATGYYGSRGAEILTENSPPGNAGFLCDLAKEWEQAAEAASRRGIRVVYPRMNFVLGTEGGGLAKMLLPFKLGLGGRLGAGDQYMSWITIDDCVESIRFAIQKDDFSGPYLASTPNPVTNLEFTKALGRVLGRPTIFPMPGFMLRTIFGEMADETLLASVRAKPAKLEAAGFIFRHPNLEEALRVLLVG